MITAFEAKGICFSSPFQQKGERGGWHLFSRRAGDIPPPPAAATPFATKGVCVSFPLPVEGAGSVSRSRI